jgi:hypothetical protein
MRSCASGVKNPRSARHVYQKRRQLIPILEFSASRLLPTMLPAKKNSAVRVEFNKSLNENELRIKAELELATFGG